MKKFFKIIPPFTFWMFMPIVGLLVISLVLFNYQTTLVTDAVAADIQPAPVSKTAMPAQVVSDDNLVSDDVQVEPSCPCERKFRRSYPVVWSGEVSNIFLGGEDFSVRRYWRTAKYNRFYVVGSGLYDPTKGEDVRVSGKLVGLTCAYSNTVFGGCVGEVVAEKIEYLP
jgi:hypothetical protein